MIGLRTPSRTVARARRGLTLLDVTITILILGIISAIAAPRLSATYRSMQLNCGATLLASKLNRVRRQAATQSVDLQIQFVATPPGFTVTLPNTTAVIDRFSLPDVPVGCSLQHSFGNQNSLLMRFRGIPAAAGTVRLIAGAQQREIQISASTMWDFLAP